MHSPRRFLKGSLPFIRQIKTNGRVLRLKSYAKMGSCSEVSFPKKLAIDFFDLIPVMQGVENDALSTRGIRESP